jgi:uncharacterized protein involved in type VI secretion and phage assembly
MAETYRALPNIKVNGSKAATEIAEDILQVVVEESLHRPSLFTIVIGNDYKSGNPNITPWNDKKQLKIGDTVSIGFDPSITKADTDEGDATQPGNLIEGEITGVEAHFTETTQAPIILRGYDLSHRLHRGRFNRSFQNMTDSDVVKKIIGQVGLDPGTIDDSGEPHDYLFQENQTNMEFLRSRAARTGFELFVQDGKLNFRKPKDNETLKLTWLDNLRSFRVRVNSTEQVEGVEVRGWDYTTKKSVVANVNAEKLLTEQKPETSKAQQDQKKGSEINSSFQQLKDTPRMVVVDQPFFKPKEADAMAQAVCNELGGQYVVADAKAEGNPQIRPGTIIELEGLGPYSGKYYVTDTRHTYAERLYTTEFSVRGLRSGDMLTTLTPPMQLRPGQTMLVGIVTDNEDPEGMGRVKVKFPTLTEDHTSNWARVVSIGAANSRGFDCLPEIDDEVLVAFEHGDIHRPYVLGGVWNGEDAPPFPVSDSVSGGLVRLRTFKTRAGHQIQFIDEDKGGSKAGVHILTKGGHELYLNDGDGSISLKSTGSLAIKSGSSMTLDAGSSMNIKAAGNITVKGAQISLN